MKSFLRIHEASMFTALEDSRFSRTDPRRYLNAESIPYLGPWLY
jgi:hypothetical protein